MTDNSNRGQVLAKLALRIEATALELAADLGWKRTLSSKYLGILHFEGKVERDYITRPDGGHFYRYRIKPPVVPSPPSQWRPQPRFAERTIKPELEEVR